MTYIDYLNDFNQWLETNALPASSQLMYYKILHVFNRAGWPEDVGVDHLRMMLMLDGASKTTIIRARDKLVAAGFIDYRKGRKGFPNRYALSIRYRNCTENATKSDTENATENATKSDTENATHIKTKTKRKENSPTESKRKVFVPPTVDEVRAYCLARKNGISPESFVAFYASKGWMVGKNKMTDWKQAVITWEQKRKAQQGIVQQEERKMPQRHHVEKMNGQEVVVFED